MNDGFADNYCDDLNRKLHFPPYRVIWRVVGRISTDIRWKIIKIYNTGMPICIERVERDNINLCSKGH